MLDRKRLLGAFALGAALATAIVVTQWRSDPAHKTAYGDGLIYRYVAAHIDTPLSRIDPVVSSRGSALRYGRIGLPAAIWLASAGRPSVMAVAQPALMIVAAGVASAAVTALVPGLGAFSWTLPFLAPGFPLSIAGGFADGFAMALGLCGVVLALRERWWAASAMLGYAVLTRENALVVVVALGVWTLLRRRLRPIVVLAAGLIPVAVWYAIVDRRFGHVPLFDPYLRTVTSTIGTPVVALVRSFTNAYSGSAIVALVVHLIMAAIVVALIRTSFFALAGAASALQLLATGPFGWRYIGEAFRVSVFLQIFLILAVVVWRDRRVATPEALGPSTA